LTINLSYRIDRFLVRNIDGVYDVYRVTN